MRRLFTSTILWLLATTYAYSQVKASYEYNTGMPYGTLDLRTHISSSEYYYLLENKTYSFRESSPGVKTDTYLDMTNWDSSPYKEGHLRHKKGTAEAFVMNYRLLMPGGYESTFAGGYPMIVHLHGAYERANCVFNNCYHSGWDYTVQENSPPAPTSATHKLLNNDDNLNTGGDYYLAARNLAGTRLPDDPSMPGTAFAGFVLAPQMMNIWDSLQVEDVVRIVRLLAEEYNIDQDRIYIQGLSIGGYGVYEAMKRASWLFAAALPMSSVSDANIFEQNQETRVAHVPVWIFQGGKDQQPTPAFTEAIISNLEKGGSVVRYSLYSDLSHTVWWRAYRQSDYYTWMLNQSKANLHAFAGNTEIDQSASQYPELMLAEGFLAYQWEKDGAILGHSANTLTVTTPGKYRARFSRKSGSPSGAQWNRWSQYVTITGTGNPTPTVNVTITSPDDGQSFTAPASINFTATASVSDGSLSKVEFYNGGTKLGQDATSPYTFTWSNVSAGNYSLSAKAIDTSGNSATDGIDITVAGAPPGGSCASTGGIQVETWTEIDGKEISSIPLNSSPSSVVNLTIFETPSNNGDRYGSRVRGYICVPTTGNYTFWIASNDNGELWLSTDESPANKTRIAYVSGWTNPRQWDKYASQRSAAVHLVADRRYYIEALLKEGTGSDHLSVGWQLPGGAFERPIPGSRLISFENNSANNLPTVNITSPDDGQSFTAPASIDLTATASDSDGSVSRVEFYNGATKLGQDATSPYTFTWNNVSAGSYTLTAKAIDNSGGAATDEIEVTVAGASGGSCASTGNIQVETWTGIEGKEISSIPLNSSPSSVADLTIFETQSNVGDHYGSRVRGYICVPTTGNYTFWIASNDRGELWLSTDESPANKTRIAYVSGWTNPRQWDKNTSQRSAAVHLVADRRYYIEALLKEGTGSDHLSVGWQLPGGALERPIPGSRLISFENNSANNLPTVNITSPDDGQSFTAPASIGLTATASDSDGSVSSVEFYNGATKLGQDATSPYTFTWNNVSAGSYTLTAKAIDNSGGAATDEVEVTVTGTPGGSCASTGGIQVETWTGIEGKDISSIPLNSSPASVADLTIFETGVNTADHYGSRVRGYICVPATGDYTFWIASNDNGELWLSTDESPANKTKIAYVSGWTNPRQWDKYASQRSAAVHLVADRSYYIEALIKEGTGSDHLSVGWQLPGGAFERPIPGSRLVKFEAQAGAMAARLAEPTQDPTSYSNINVYPNPAVSADARITVGGYEGIRETIQTQVEIINMTGEVVFTQRIQCGGDCSDYLINIHSQLVPGVYIVNLKTGGARNSQRLFVR